ncbi:MAG: PEP-CTERM sorting domain-containing protein [Phycisphaeraceae bacterium]|nr:PEP-CTERM sorting domain-containing protein [Phycisphaeraceae bacterium]
MTTGAVANGVVDDNSAYDRFFMGPWTENTTGGGWRDNIDANGDNWLGQNAGFISKDDFGADTGDPAGMGWVGGFRGGPGDVLEVFYTFSATEAIGLQDWAIKGIVNRLPDRHGRLYFDVNVNSSGWTNVDVSSIFGNGSVTFDIDMGDVTSGFSYDGPEEYRTADLSALGIDAGDSVVYRFRQIQNNPSGAARHIGLGVALIPEPASLALLGLGGLTLLRRKR